MTIFFLLGQILNDHGFFYTNHPPAPDNIPREIDMAEMSECVSNLVLSISSVENYNNTRNIFSIVIGRMGRIRELQGRDTNGALRTAALQVTQGSIVTSVTCDYMMMD